MIRGLQHAAGVMAAEQLRQDAIAHNLANLDTAGFRRLVVAIHAGRATPLFRRDVGGPALGTLGSAQIGPRLVLDLSPGELQVTGDSNDLAIEGRGFILVEGNRLAPGGRLGVDREGFLTLGGARVEGTGGPIRVGRGHVGIQADGTVQADGQVVGRLRIVALDPDRLEPAGAGMYMAAPGAAFRESDGVCRQGMRERPRVNPIEEMAQMVAGLRAYEAAQRALQVSDETLARAVQQIGSIG